MDDITHTQSSDRMLKNTARVGEDPAPAGPSDLGLPPENAEGEAGGRRKILGRNRQSYSHTHFKVYKRRWFGLAQLVLLNIVVSWDVCNALLHISLSPKHLPSHT